MHLGAVAEVEPDRLHHLERDIFREHVGRRQNAGVLLITLALDQGASAPNTVLEFASSSASVFGVLDGGCSRAGRRARRKPLDERRMISL